MNSAERRGTKRWDDDHYSRLARQRGYRSRSAFKLLDIQRRTRLLRPGGTVLDIGAAPGGFSQVVAELIGSAGLVVALDRQPIAPLLGVRVLQIDMNDPSALDRIRAVLDARQVDVLLCDAAPALSGVAAVDEAACDVLVECALALAAALCAPSAQLLLKLFQGRGGDAQVQSLRSCCQRLRCLRTSSSRSASREFYVHATGLSLKRLSALPRMV